MLAFRDHQRYGHIPGEVPLYRSAPLVALPDVMRQKMTDEQIAAELDELMKMSVYFVRFMLEYCRSEVLPADMRVQYCGGFPCDWKGLSESAKFRDWAKEKSFGVLIGMKDQQLQTDAKLVTFVVNHEFITKKLKGGFSVNMSAEW